MSHGHTAPPPYPEGWYCLGLSRELRPGDVRALTVFGGPRVLFRTADGAPALLDAHCPHLGAHLGYGGRVEGETLRCPMHGFCFGPDGECTSTPYGSKPPARARSHATPLVERHGLLLAWHGAEHPRWAFPALDDTGYRPLVSETIDVRTHVQEIVENSVDIGHFPEVHGYRDVVELAPVQVDGPLLRARYAFTRTNPFAASLGPIRVTIAVSVYGLGVSMVDACTEPYGMRTRLFVLPTPVAERQTCLRIACTLPTPSDAGLPLSLVPPSLLQRLVMKGYCADVLQDFDIWEHKAWIHPPALAPGDGPIGRYRSWARQFYTTAAPEETHP